MSADINIIRQYAGSGNTTLHKFKSYLRATIVFSLLSIASLLLTNSAFAATRAIWIWENDAYKMLGNDKVRQRVEDFLIQHHISIMYLYADEFRDRNILVKEPKRYRKLIAKAHARGLKVYALLGSKYLHTEAYVHPDKQTIAMRMFRNVLEYNRKAPDVTSRFDGINIDIEPYLLKDWKSARKLRLRQYLDLSVAFMQMKKSYGMDLPVGPAMPFWYDGIDDVKWQGKRQIVSEYVQSIYDYVAIMDYRNVALGSDSIVSLSRDELEYADKIGKKVMIGVETLNTTPVKVTFYGKTNEYFEEQLALAEESLSKYKSFTGFVIHHLEPYHDLVKQSKR
jgi:hypothetical protein